MALRINHTVSEEVQFTSSHKQRSFWRFHDLSGKLAVIHALEAGSSGPTSLKNIQINLGVEVWYLVTVGTCRGTSGPHYRRAPAYTVIVLGHEIMHCLVANRGVRIRRLAPHLSFNMGTVGERCEARDWVKEKLTCSEVLQKPSSLGHIYVLVPANRILQMYARAAVQTGFHVWYLESIYSDARDLFASIVDVSGGFLSLLTLDPDSDVRYSNVSSA
ncbi:hypothetical protein C8R44DRAFT_738422 [Mycena epipterygia]|nr:hypothetical protein C8R44DRAFT_738422 [Mycena epipterygia]